MWQWVLNNIGWLTSLLVAIITAIIAIIGVIKKDSPAGKVLKGILKVVQQFPNFIRQAEKVSDDPEEKKTFVLNQAILNCQAQGFTPTEEQLAEMSAQIDDQVKLSKDINLHSKNTNTTNAKIITKIGV